MKKCLAFLVSLIMLTLLCACNNPNNAAETDSSVTSSNDVTADRVSPSHPQEFEVTLSAENITSNGKPIFEVTSNLPDNTELLLTLENASGFTAQDKVTLQNGQGRSSEFSEYGDPLSGTYTLNIAMRMPALQDQAVQDVIGGKGEYMTGDVVKESSMGDSVYNSIEAEFSFDFETKDEPNTSIISSGDDSFVSDGVTTMGERNALESAKQYIRVMAFSYSGLIGQLEFEGYSLEEATYGADHCGADWYEQAALSAKEYLNVMSFSRQGLIEQLEYEGFTYDQAVYGVEQNGY